MDAIATSTSTSTSTSSSRKSGGGGGTTSIHITALDEIIHVNSLFTFAVFIGFAWIPTDPNNSLITQTESICKAGPSIHQALIEFHVYSFSCFLFSSLIAQTLKQNFRNPKCSVIHRAELPHRINQRVLRVGMLVSGLGSVFGCGFLTMALVNMVEIKLGPLRCGSSYSYAAIVPLLTFVPVALVIYVCTVLYAFFTH